MFTDQNGLQLTMYQIRNSAKAVPRGKSVQFSSVAQSCLTLCDPMNSQHARPPCPSPTPGVHSDSCPSSQWCHPSHLILCRPLLILPPIPPSIRVFSNESALRMRWPKYWSFSFSIIPSKEIPGLISFRIDWLDLLAVQETLKSLLQHHSSKAWMALNVYLGEKKGLKLIILAPIARNYKEEEN